MNKYNKLYNNKENDENNYKNRKHENPAIKEATNYDEHTTHMINRLTIGE